MFKIYIKNIFVVILCILFFSACSKSAKDITAKYVSPELYSDYDCQQIRAELRNINGKVAALTGDIDANNSTDDMTTTAGLILFWPALFFIGGTKEQEAEYAQLKGEFNALEKISIRKKCFDQQ
jgi:hypothetical protein